MTDCPLCGSRLSLVPDDLGGEPLVVCEFCDLFEDEIERALERLGQMRLRPGQRVVNVATGGYL